MTDLPLVSATQISLWQECQRKWGFKYLDRIPDPPKPGALLGTEVQDTQLDPWLAEARPFDLTRPSGEIAQALAPLLPKPKAPGMRLRPKFRMPSPTGRFGYQGEFDLEADDSIIVPGVKGGYPLLGDVKTMKSLKYAKTKKALLTDTQCQLYAAKMVLVDGRDEIDAVWFNAQTQGARRTSRVHVHLAAPHVVEQFERLDEISSRLITIKLARPKVSELPPTYSMCREYGGCPYQKICNPSPADFASTWNEGASESMGSTNDFLAGLRKQVGAPAPSPDLASAVTQSVQAQGSIVQTKFGPAVQEPEHAPTVPQALEMQAAAIAAALAKGPPKINPPETELPPAPATGGVAEAPAAAKPKRGRPRKDATTAITSPLTIIEPPSGPVEFPRAELADFLRALLAWVEEP